jgi:hypothetical protein
MAVLMGCLTAISPRHATDPHNMCNLLYEHAADGVRRLQTPCTRRRPSRSPPRCRPPPRHAPWLPLSLAKNVGNDASRRASTQRPILSDQRDRSLQISLATRPTVAPNLAMGHGNTLHHPTVIFACTCMSGRTIHRQRAIGHLARLHPARRLAGSLQLPALPSRWIHFPSLAKDSPGVQFMVCMTRR